MPFPSKLDKTDAARWAAEGLVLADIAARAGIAEHTARHLLRRHGYVPAPRRVVPVAELARLCARTGFRELARELGYSEKGCGGFARTLKGLGLACRDAERPPVSPSVRPPAARRRTGCPPAPPHPFWTPERDALLIARGDTYSGRDFVARKLGVPVSRVTARWHIVRVAA